ncbi:spore germination protein [Lysinibacillus sp. FSL K6-1151]|uniref:spore germination protein n=1 Tax=unclassified Lysinibacillus TaxID=2636778 RepID=UPI00315B30EE
MENMMMELSSKFADHDDFFVEEELIDQTTIYLMGFKTLIDFAKSNLYIRQMAASSASVGELFTNLSDQLDMDIEQIVNAVLEGKLIVLSQGGRQNAIVDPISINLTRSIEEPKNESPIQASMDAFVEDIHVNVGLIRKRLKTARLSHCTFQVGELEKRNLSMLYINGRASSDLIEKVNQQLKEIDTDIESIDDLNKYFGVRRGSPVSHFFPTEVPIQAIHALKKNRIVLFLDNYPFALVFPHLLPDMFSIVNDRNFPYVLSVMLRVLRVVGAILTLILPALYVALVSVNPEIFKFDLALFVAKSREGIPVPALLETIIMVVLIDLILEAIVRLPKSIGPTISMVGGVILGQAMVEAKLVSTLLVIVITAIVISSSVVAGIQNSLYIRLLKYPILILASIFGILGIFTGLALTGIYLASLTSFHIPYTTFRLKREGDTK